MHNSYLPTNTFPDCPAPQYLLMVASSDAPPTGNRREYLLHRVQSFCSHQRIPQRYRFGLPAAKIYPASKARGSGQPSAFPADVGAGHHSRYSLGLMTFRDANVDVLAPLCNATVISSVSTDEIERTLWNAGAGELLPPVDLALQPPPMFPVDRPQKIPNTSTMLFIKDLVTFTTASLMLYFVFLAVCARFWPKRREPELPRWLAPTRRADSLPSLNELPYRISAALLNALRLPKIMSYVPVSKPSFY